MFTPPPNVLVVDQMPAIRILLARRFARVGCQPHEAPSTLAALRLVKSEIKFDLAVIELLPSDGLSELILSIGRAKVFLTSSRNEADVAEEFQCRYWQKPFSINSLIAAALPVLPNRAAVTVERIRPHEVSSSIVQNLGESPSTSVRRLAIALQSCASCNSRCPGLSACQIVQGVLRNEEEQSTRLAS